VKKATTSAAQRRAEPLRTSFATIPSGCADFLARVAHDLRSPLGVIAEVIPTIQNDLAEHLTDEHRLLLKLADRGVRRLKMFVDRMRLVADLELSRLDLAHQPTALGEVIQAGMETILACEPRRGVTVAFDPSTDSTVVAADAHKLVHVMVELLSNALRHAHSQVRISLVRENSEVKIVVEDDGDGVADSQAQLLFSRFVERPSRTGLGIGLSLAHDLVTAQGGRLAVEKSTLPARSGKIGAKFVVSFNVAQG